MTPSIAWPSLGALPSAAPRPPARRATKAGRLRAALLGLCAALAPAAASAQAAAVPVERFFEHPRVVDALLSPSGRRVAITAAGASGRIGLGVIDLEAFDRSGLTTFQDVDVIHPAWVGDDRVVFGLLDLQAGSGDDRRTGPGLFAMDVDKRRVRMLVRPQHRGFFTEPERHPVLDPNHVLLHVPRAPSEDRTRHVVVGRLSGSGNDITATTPLWLDVDSGATRAVDVGRAPPDAVHWWFDGRGVPRVALTNADGRSALHRRGDAGADGDGSAAWRRIAEAPLGKLPFAPVAVDGAGTLFVVVPEGAEGREALTVWSDAAQSPQLPARFHVPGFDFHGAVLLGDVDGRAIGVRAHAETEATVWLTEPLKRMQALADARWPDRINRLSCARCGTPEMVVLVRSYSDRDPGRLWLYESRGERWRPLATVMPGIDPRLMAPVELRRIAARDGRELPLWLTLPHGVGPRKPAPGTVVLVHGGPWVRGGHWRWQPLEQFLASRGWLVIAPEFRGSAGYGEAHRTAGNRQWGRAMQDDVADALRWAQREGLAGERACIVGASYGGYSALMGLARDGDLWRCGAAAVAVTDLELFVRGSWWIDDDVSGQGRRWRLPELVGDPQADAAMLRERSPVHLAQSIRAPLLLAIGGEDRRVPPAHGRRMRDALEAAGRPPQWVVYGDEAHSWRKAETWIDYARRLEALLKDNLDAKRP